MGLTERAMMKMHQINEDDLAELERRLPAMADANMKDLTPADRVAWRAIQAILSRVRWNYGPPTEVEEA